MNWCMSHKIASLTAVLLSLTACQLLNQTPNYTAVPPTPTATPVITPAPLVTSIIPTPPTQPATTLIIWLPPEIYRSKDTGTAVLFNQLLSFDASHPEVELVIEEKSITGEGGILNYLRTGRTIAPDILPDLIALHSDQLTVAASEELIYPLDDVLPPGLLEDLFPAAQRLARPAGQTISYPFALTDLSHLAYNSNVFTSTLPLTWGEWISDTIDTLILPAAGTEGARLALQFYLAAGGTLTNESGQPHLQAGPLATALERLSLARSQGVILLQSSNTTTLNESWQIFQAGTAVFAQTTTNQFLRERANATTTGFAAIPGLQLPLSPLVNGWVWAVSTPDATQKALAAELIIYLTAAPELATWNWENQMLPTRRSAFAAWPADDPYVLFVRQQLEQAQINPLTPTNPIMAVLQNATFDAISLTKPPRVAADEAVEALQP